jgi:NADH-quinone oxidoreductase subunit L
MMLALGSAGYVAGVFHLTTHAFFKALLFLAAGSVIHAAHTQNIDEMGGLWKKMRTTGILFLIGTLAITGVPLFSGFFSKEEILIAAWVNGNPLLFALALIAAFFTAFYMFRLFFLVFTGEARGDQRQTCESPSVMTIPMMVLGVLAVVAGYMNTPWFGHFLGDWLTEGTDMYGPSHIEGPAWIMVAAILVSVAGIGIAYLIYYRRSIDRATFSTGAPHVYGILRNKYFVDEFYFRTFVYGTKVISLFLKYVDEFLVHGTMKGIAYATQSIGRLGAKMQNGQTQVYSAVAFVGLAILLIIFAFTGGYIG